MSCFKKDGTLKKVYAEEIMPTILSAEFSKAKILEDGTSYNYMGFKYESKHKKQYSELLNELGIKYEFDKGFCHMLIDPDTLSMLRG